MICFCSLNIRSTASETRVANEKEGDARTKARHGNIPKAGGCNRHESGPKGVMNKNAKGRGRECERNPKSSRARVHLGAEL